MDEGQPEVRTAEVAPPVARGRHTGLMHTMHCLLLNGLVLPAANLAVALARYGMHSMNEWMNERRVSSRVG